MDVVGHLFHARLPQGPRPAQRDVKWMITLASDLLRVVCTSLRAAEIA